MILAVHGRRQAHVAHHGHQDYLCKGSTSQIARFYGPERALSSPKDWCSAIYAGDTIAANLPVPECYRRHLASSWRRPSSASTPASQPNLTDTIATTGYELPETVMSACLNISSIATADCKYIKSSDAVLRAHLYLSTIAAAIADSKHSSSSDAVFLVDHRLNTTAVAECKYSRSSAATILVDPSLHTTIAAKSEYC